MLSSYVFVKSRECFRICFFCVMFLCVYARENEMRVVGCRHVKFRGVDGKEGDFKNEIAKHFTFYTNYDIIQLC